MAAAKKKGLTPEDAAKQYRIDIAHVRYRTTGRGLEVTTTAAGKILDMLPSSVRRRARPPYNDIEGEEKGRDLWLYLDSVLAYGETRREAGRPIDTIAGESKNKRGERETEYQREYKREYRRHGPKGTQGAKKGGGKGKKGTSKSAPTRRAAKASKGAAGGRAKK
jgi:hypothetical protein